jgi:protein-tyrosine phosphatase
MKILMVCLGNICRSPVAEGVMRAKAKEHVIEVEIDSAGTSGWHDGAAPDERSLTNASKNGIDISKQKSRKVVLSDFEVFDFLYAMDESNYNNLLNMASQKYHHKIKMILNEVNAGDNRSVPDPYYGKDGFQLVFDLLDEACEKIAQNLKR